MDDFKTFWQAMASADREAFATACGTTIGYCHQIAYGKRIELGLADVLVAHSGGKLTLDALNLTPRAEHQRTARRVPVDHAAARQPEQAA